MATTHSHPNTSKETVRRYRQKMRAMGFRTIQIWVPDSRSPKFIAECHRQSALVAKLTSEDKIMDFIEKVQDTDEWTS